MNARSIPGLTDEAGSFRQDTGRFACAARNLSRSVAASHASAPFCDAAFFTFCPLLTTPSPIRPVPRITLPPLCFAALGRRAIVRLPRAARLFPTTSAPQTRFGLHPSFHPSARRRCRAVVHVSGYNIVRNLSHAPSGHAAFFRQHPASAWGARLLRLPREKLGLSFPALDIFESRLYKDFQI